MSAKPTVLITGASSGIGATYADRFAGRGHDLVLVARDQARLDAVAARAREKGVGVEVIQADLADPDALARVAARLAEGDIGILVNNAGMNLPGTFAGQTGEGIDQLLAVNVVAVTRLANAAARAVAAGGGAIINISSVVGMIPEFGAAAYAASKSFVTTLSQAMAFELDGKGVHVQGVLPAATATDIWTRSGADPASLPAMMEVGVLVDAALAGFDRKEAITIPVLPDAGQWDAYQAARLAMLPNFGNVDAAERYRVA